LSAGCGGSSLAPEPASQALAENGTDLVDLSSRLAAITASFVSSEGPTHLKASTVQGVTGPFYAPSHCFTAMPDETDGATTIVSFAHCDGPWGLASLDGQLNVKQVKNALAFTARNFRLGDAEVTFAAQASIVFDGASRTMDWAASSLTGTTARGRAFTISSTMRVVWQVGGTCITANGEFGGGVPLDGSVAAKVSGLSRCTAACPNSGSVEIWPLPQVQPAGAPGGIEVSLTGSNVAYFVANGGINPLTLTCGQ
jgi:hypothetical protein